MRSFKSRSWHLLAIAILTLTVLGGYTFIQDQSAESAGLTKAANLEQSAYPMFTSNVNADVKSVFALCQKKKYTQALALIEGLDESTQLDPRFTFAKGLCFLNLDYFQQASQVFTQLIEEGHPFIEDQTMWYLAITNIKLEKVEEAQSFLEILAGEPTSDFHIQAVNLLKELEDKPV